MPVRPIPKNYTTVTGAASSSKSDDLVSYEGRLEFEVIKLVTFNLNVLKCEEQPVKLHYVHDGRHRTYHPDLRVTFKQGLQPCDLSKPLLIEAKPRRRLFKNLAEFRPKFRAARRYAEETGQDFTIITDLEVRRPYLKAVLFLLKFRALPVDESATELLLRTIKDLGTTSPDELMLKIAETDGRRAELLPTLWQLVANFSIHVDLEQPLTMDSSISLIARNDECAWLEAGCMRRNRWRAIRRAGFFDDLEA